MSFILYIIGTCVAYFIGNDAKTFLYSLIAAAIIRDVFFSEGSYMRLIVVIVSMYFVVPITYEYIEPEGFISFLWLGILTFLILQIICLIVFIPINIISSIYFKWKYKL